VWRSVVDSGLGPELVGFLEGCGTLCGKINGGWAGSGIGRWFGGLWVEKMLVWVGFGVGRWCGGWWVEKGWVWRSVVCFRLSPELVGFLEGCGTLCGKINWGWAGSGEGRWFGGLWVEKK